jgi:hypothetical protein
MRHNSRLRQYILDSQSETNPLQRSERRFGADGQIDKDLFYTGPGGGSSNGNFFNANAAAAQSAMPTSDPYMVQISNASATQINNFDIWGAIIYLDQQRFSWSAGSLTISGVTISSVLGGAISYYTMLSQSNTNNFQVGKTYMAVVSGSNSQIVQPLTLKTYDISGLQAQRPIQNPLAPNQYQAGVMDNKTKYRIDGYTAVSINVMASAVFQIWFYPEVTINTSRALAGQDAAQSFVTPVISVPTVLAN